MHDIHALDGPPGRKIAALADRQHGVVAVWQLKELGLGRGAIAHQVRSGRLHRLYRGVYAVGHVRITTHGRLMAAVLACGPDAVLSHRSATELWGFRRTASAQIDVSVPGRSRAGQKGIRLHRVRRLHPEDRTVLDGMPVTTVARTLLDCAAALGPRRTRNAIEDSERLRLFDLREVEATCARSNGHRGVGPLREAIAEVHGEPPDTRSPLEERFLDFCRDAGLPIPATNVSVCGYEVDAAWIEQRVVVELDSYAFHGTRAAFERDRTRDAALQEKRFRVLRVTHRRLTGEAPELERTINSFFAL